MVRTEMAAVSATPAPSMRDPHTYDSPAMGMRISLPDDWKLMREEPGSFSQPRSAMFGKSGTAAMFMLTRERMEGSPELYQKMIEASFSTRQDYKRAGEEAVKRDGLAGTRWNVSWNENGVPYTSVMEIYSVGDDHYRLTTLAPTEVYRPLRRNFRKYHALCAISTAACRSSTIGSNEVASALFPYRPMCCAALCPGRNIYYAR